MRVYVNDRPIDLLPGMRVRHALQRAGLLEEVGSATRPLDEWGNELGLDGALSEEVRIYVKRPESFQAQGR